MKSAHKGFIIRVTCVLAAIAIWVVTPAAFAASYGTSFTYQGRLREKGLPYNGNAEFRPTLWDAETGGTQVAANAPAVMIVRVSEGLFLLPLDFGANFSGPARWVQLEVRTTIGEFTVLAPRQPLTAAPYALHAQTAQGLNAPGNQSVDVNVGGLRALRLQVAPDGAINTIGGSPVNNVASGVQGATIGGGGMYSSPWMEYSNAVSADFGTVSGGLANAATGFAATIAGGEANRASEQHTTVAGGYRHTASGFAATIAGGQVNTASETFATVGGGAGNTASGRGATIPGGFSNMAQGNHSFAAGLYAKALHNGSFVWADAAVREFASTTENEFSIRAAGGVRVESGRGITLDAVNAPLITRGYDPFTSGPYQGLGRWGLFMVPYNLVIAIPGEDVAGQRWFQVGKFTPDGQFIGLMVVDQTGYVQARVFNPTSDRAAKENFEPIDSGAILTKVAALPLSEWNFKDDGSARHLGPVAQDFYAAFGLGTDERHIATVDADGVALAAIQGLNKKMEAENAALRKELADLRLLVQELSAKLNRSTL